MSAMWAAVLDGDCEGADLRERPALRRSGTPRGDPDTGRMIQIVSPERLREILDADGETYEPPSGFDSDDEWEVAS